VATTLIGRRRKSPWIRSAKCMLRCAHAGRRRQRTRRATAWNTPSVSLSSATARSRLRRAGPIRATTFQTRCAILTGRQSTKRLSHSTTSPAAWRLFRRDPPCVVFGQQSAEAPPRNRHRRAADRRGRARHMRRLIPRQTRAAGSEPSLFHTGLFGLNRRTRH